MFVFVFEVGVNCDVVIVCGINGIGDVDDDGDGDVGSQVEGEDVDGEDGCSGLVCLVVVLSVPDRCITGAIQR